MDKRSDRVQPIRLTKDFFPLDIHKTMFINDLLITIPSSYVKNWGEEVLNSHNRTNCKWPLIINYQGPKELNKINKKFHAILQLSFPKGRKQISNYRIKWSKDFAIQLAKDYPKSFVRALEYHIGDEYYKNLRYTEFDIGGFKEQLQVKIEWVEEKPILTIKEFFRVKEAFQGFPNIFKELSSYLITDFLLSTEDELSRRIQITEWQNRDNISKEIHENILYMLLNRKSKEIYIGETKQSLSKRYPINKKHHSFNKWTEYSIIQLPPETTDQSRKLIERVLITANSKLFQNNSIIENDILHEYSFKIKNKN